MKQPDYFIMAYAIITGAHFFPYAWFYNEPAYAVAAGVLSIGALLIALNIPVEKMYYVAIYTVVVLFVLAVSLFISYKRKLKIGMLHAV